MIAKQTLNSNLHVDKSSKTDEFYTQLIDIETELEYYKQHFKDKVVYCNCDDPRISNFFHYFSYNFERLGLKKLIATCYKNQNMNVFSDNESKQAIYLDYIADQDDNKVPKPEDICVMPLKGDGDFRNQESIELLKQADIVVTNPPFSLFREYTKQLIEYDKKFLIIGDQNVIAYKEILTLIRDGRIWLGVDNGGTKWFGVKDHYDIKIESRKKIVDEKQYFRMGGMNWYTNLDYEERHEYLILYKNYSSEEYPKYDNYDAINVNEVADIPYDYSGVMGVPITFLDTYNSDQFEILGITSGRDEFEAIPTKRYKNPKQINKDGSITNGRKANTRATLIWPNKPNGIYYTADNATGYLSILYARILIKNKRVDGSIHNELI